MILSKDAEEEGMRIEETCVRQWEVNKNISAGGRSFPCRMITEELPFFGEDGLAATAFTYTYMRTDEDSESRPVIFAYNGGPGSSCVWIHLGLLGPMRVKMRPGEAKDAEAEVNPSVSGPYGLEENPYCILDEADVVLLDPPGCGFGKVADEQAAKECFGIRQDAGCTAQIIERWLARYQRFSSPKYLLGESYGTIRSCMLLRELMGGPMSVSRRLRAIPVDGVIMMGTALNLEPIGNTYPVEPCLLQLIGMTASRLYHRPLSEEEAEEWRQAGLFVPDQEEGWEGRLADAVWTFAGTRYLPALFQGNALEETKKQEMTRCLSLLTGVEPGWFEKHGLALPADVFTKECLKQEGLEMGFYDSRYTMQAYAGSSFLDPVADDPAMGQYTPVYMGAMNGEMKEYLGIRAEVSDSCCGIDFAVNGQWDYGSPEKPEQCLEAAMRRNKGLRVLFMTGLYDLVTPPGAVRYLVSHQQLPKERIVIREYASGHMPYMGKESAKKVSEDLRSFIRG